MKEIKFIWAFYLMAFSLAILSGLRFGFTDSHTPPMPFILSAFFILVGLIWVIIDLILLTTRKNRTWKTFFAHFCGLAMNGVFIIYLTKIGTETKF